MHDVWDENWWGSTKTLDVHIASLRKKLEPDLIETVRAVGFRLVAPPGRDAMTRRLLASYLLITALTLVLLEVPLGVFFAQRERERIAADLEHDATSSPPSTRTTSRTTGRSTPRRQPSTADAPAPGWSSSTATASR